MTLIFRLLARRFLRLRLLLSDYVTHCDADVLVVLAGMGLRRAAPAAIQQDARRRHAREARDASGLEEATNKAAEALTNRFGSGAVEGRMRALVISATR